MKVIDFPQGSDEWKASRAGRVTASRISDVLSRARDRKGEGTTRRKYKLQIALEILTGQPQEKNFTNKAMEAGTENEPFARSAYEVAKDLMVDQVGLVLHPRIERSAASPDGLIDLNGCMQIKCPEPLAHVDYLLSGVAPTEHQPQMLWEMACAEREWCDFVSYCAALPENGRLYVFRFMRDDKEIARIEAEVKVFLDEAAELAAKLQARVQ